MFCRSCIELRSKIGGSNVFICFFSRQKLFCKICFVLWRTAGFQWDSLLLIRLEAQKFTVTCCEPDLFVFVIQVSAETWHLWTWTLNKASSQAHTVGCTKMPEHDNGQCNSLNPPPGNKFSSDEHTCSTDSLARSVICSRKALCGAFQ